MGKQNLYDHSVRVPFIMSGPGVPVGKRIDAPIYLQDIVPTTLELAGDKKIDDLDFQSLVPLLKGEGKPRERIYGAYMELQRMIQKGSRKLILYPDAKVARVFDLAKDPHEMKDLAGTAEGKVVIKELFPELLELQKELNDPLDLKLAFPEIVVP
jgi:choline-sulfatase